MSLSFPLVRCEGNAPDDAGYADCSLTCSCPPPSKCACEFFGACQPIEWSVPPEGLGPLPAE